MHHDVQGSNTPKTNSPRAHIHQLLEVPSDRARRPTPPAHAAGPHLGLTAFALFRFDDEPKTRVAPSLAFAGLPTIRRDGLLGAGHKLRVA